MIETTRPPAGVFVVRDPGVCAALEQLLAPHRTEPTPADPAAASSQVAALMAAAEAHAAELTGEPTSNLPPDATIEQLLDHVHRDGQLSKQDLDEARDELVALADRLNRAETALHRADSAADATRGQLRDALSKITELEARPQTRRPTVSATRLKDQAAFASLARRMEDQAKAKPKGVGDILRIAARAVRDEIDTVYGPAAKAS